MATNAELTKEVEVLNGQVTSLKQQVQDKTDAAQAAYSGRQAAEDALATEKSAHATTRQERDAARDQVNGAGQFIKELNEQLSQAQEAGNQDPTKPRKVKHDGKNYHVVLPKFRYAGRIYDALEVVEGGQLLADLVRAESGVLAEVE